MNRRNTKKPPRDSSLRTVIESLEPRAMLAGVGPESWSASGLAPAPLGNGVLFSSGVILTCSSPTLGSSGTSSPPAPTSGSGGTTSGGDLWDSFSAGSGAGGSTSGSTGGVSKDGPALSSQYTGGSGAGGQGNGTGGTLTNADLLRLYWSGAGAGSSSSSSDEGSLANDPTLEAKYTGGSGGGPVFFVTGATGADAANSESQQRTTGSTTLTLADGQSPVMTTPLVYQPDSDDGPGVVSAEWTGDDGEVQVVPVAEHLTDPDIASDSANVPRWSRYRTERETITSTVRQKPWAAPRPNDIEFMDAAGNRWLTNQGEISAYGPPPRAPTLSQFAEAGADLLAAFFAGRSLQPRGQSFRLGARNSTAPGSYRPNSPLPRGPNGGVLPSSPQPHTQLGTEIGRKVGPYTAAREFGSDGQPIRDIHFTDHGRPNVPGHINPHQHRHIPNPTGGTPEYGPAEPFNP